MRKCQANGDATRGITQMLCCGFPGTLVQPEWYMCRAKMLRATYT